MRCGPFWNWIELIGCTKQCLFNIFMAFEIELNERVRISHPRDLQPPPHCHQACWLIKLNGTHTYKSVCVCFYSIYFLNCVPGELVTSSGREFSRYATSSPNVITCVHVCVCEGLSGWYVPGEVKTSVYGRASDVCESPGVRCVTPRTCSCFAVVNLGQLLYL